MVTVVLGTFDPITELGLREVLREDQTIEVLSAGLESAELKRALVLRTSEVMIIDEIAAREVLPYLSLRTPTTGTVVLAADPSVVYRKLANACGAFCLPGCISPEELLATVHSVSGKRDAARGRQSDPAQPGFQVGVRLTPREADVLAHLSKDRSYAEVALMLKISVETVRSHASSIRLKLDVSTRRELVGMPVPRLKGREPTEQLAHPHSGSAQIEG